MENSKIKVFGKISLIFFLYLLVSYFYEGITTIPVEGDSLIYHIPIAKSILTGEFIRPKFYLGFYPSVAEAILSFFIFLGLPLNLFNVLGWILLFFSTRYLGLLFGLRKNLSLIFAVSICSLHVIVRWLLAQVIDIWLAVFFVISIILLEKPEKKTSYFIKLGFMLGMLIGTKYTGPLFATVLLFFYFKKVIKHLDIQRFIAFIVPLALFGLFWYIRNYILIQNLFYPQTILFFEGKPGWDIFKLPVWKAAIAYPIQMLNAFISEYMIWSFSLLVAPIFFLYTYIKKLHAKFDKIKTLILIGILNCFIYLFLPTSPKYNIIVSSFRYSYPAFILLILSLFLIAQAYKKEEIISITALANMIMLPSLDYHPKLLFILLPLVFFVEFLISKKDPIGLKGLRFFLKKSIL